MTKKIKITLITILIVLLVVINFFIFTDNFNQKNYSVLVDNNKYQVFLFKSPIFFPLIFAIHPWFVLNNKGEISRWEIGFSFSNTYSKTGCGYIYKNWKPSFQGIGFFPFAVGKFFNRSSLVGKIEGEEAKKVIDFIYNSPSTYTHCNEYYLWGPNSNTYVQWVINNFPESGLKLSNNAYGKDYK